MRPAQKGIREMRVCHGVAARFDDPNLVSCAGLLPILQLAERAGFEQLVAEHVSIAKPGGVNAELKVSVLVAGMVAGADSIEDMAVLRHDGMDRAPSTLGTSLRTFTFGHVRQLDAVVSRLLINLPGTLRCCPGPTSWPISMLTTRSARFTATPSRAPVAAIPGARG
jgi:hypothetical protein